MTNFICYRSIPKGLSNPHIRADIKERYVYRFARKTLMKYFKMACNTPFKMFTFYDKIND